MGAYKGYKVHITKDGNETGTPSELSFNENGGYQAQGGAGQQAAGGGLGVRNKALNMGLVYMGKQAMNYGLSNYGNLTGDYITQDQIGAVTELAGMVTSVLVGGWLGAVAVTTQLGLKVVNRGIDISKSRATSNIQMERLGLTKGGSRL